MAEIYSNSEKIDFFEKIFGKSEKTNKGNIEVKCPKCEKECANLGITLKKRKLAINILKYDLFHCWVCGYKGQIIRALKDYSSRELLKEYLKRFAHPKLLAKHKEEKPYINKTILLPGDFRLLAIPPNGKNDYYFKKGIEYARLRGLEERDLWKFRVGISNEYPWTNRLLFPSFDYEGDLNYIVGRSWIETQFQYWDTEINKTKIIFNEININWGKELTITEGIMDLVRCNDNSVPLLGSSLSKNSYLFRQIVQYETPILLALDKDMIYKKMPNIVDMVLKSGNKIRVLDLGEYDDVGEMTKEEFEKRRKDAKRWDEMKLIRHKISQVGSTFRI